MANTTPSSIVLGCSVAVISSGIQSLGITLQRKSHLLHASDGSDHHHIHHQHHHQHHHKHIQRQKRNMWLFGFLLFIVANILGSLIQISTLPLIILSPLQSIGLIFNSILSCLLLPGEKFTSKLGSGTLLISIGAFIIAYNGNVAPVEDGRPPSNIDERFSMIVTKLLRPAFVWWFSATFVMIGVLLIFNYVVLASSKKPCNFRKLNIGNKSHFIKGINFGIISGTLTAHTFLFAKSIIDVIIESIFSNKKGQSWLPSKDFTPYFLLIIMLLIIGFQLTAFNLGLKQILTSILYPLCFLIYNFFNLINDIIFNALLAEHKITYSQLAWIVTGLVGVLFGVVLISWDSAFGGDLSEDIDASKISDEYLMYREFPYNQEETTKLLSNNHITDADTSLSSDEQVYDSTNDQSKLSFEQNQLLNSLDI
ncbi:uncharacterized protein CANTADRAFT_20090 [Suhomyces tanzawaensis NRRL Y-17324]|uniref:DUF803-domain-containing protein n=1 Tax=Suhomyces tanzawaensis NRRL Y-17324 TaxID=984487 RepID=A0A1E4SLV2_9ASCO|nr:uncharacterized protein CANTADRAFT_20090 [Suhomyces tanzawaensis NRRL Y-17324]ODV80504.1 hypothetical protein CANTADRAFT_20090 [Suhomyces tanzawaensis NRRL Y-17324]